MIKQRIEQLHNIDFNDLVGRRLKNYTLYQLRYKIVYELRYKSFLYGLNKQMSYRDIRSLFNSPTLWEWNREGEPPILTREHLAAEVLRVHGIELDKLSRDMMGLVIYNLRNDPMIYNVSFAPAFKALAYVFGYAWMGTPRRILLEYKKRNGL